MLKHTFKKSCYVVLSAVLLSASAHAADQLTAKVLQSTFYPTYPSVTIKPGVDKALVEKGEYLVKIGDCISCHTNMPDKGKPFAGGLPLHTPFGTFFAPNITPDKETGIGKWTNADFIRAVHEGVNPRGQDYFPVFPYTSFTKVSKEDLIAIKAYLDSIPPVKQANKAPTAPWPFSWRFAQIFWKWLFFNEGYYQYQPEHSPMWNRGAYLVQGLGHCGECHTPRNLLGAMEAKYYLTGAFVDGFWAPDITHIEFKDTPFTGVVDVFDKALLINKAGSVRGPMAEVDHNSLMKLKPEDLDAIALYLKTVISAQPRLPKGIPGVATHADGKKVYKDVCAICHDQGVAGAPKLYDTANWAWRLQQGIATLYDHAVNGYNNMPAKGGCVTCSAYDVEAAVNYILSNNQTATDKRSIFGGIVPKPDTSIELGKVVYGHNCAICHDGGSLGAPKLGDKAVWQPLLAKNLDVLIQNTLNGMHNMPAKGGCARCSNAEIVAAVKYMAQQANPDADYSLW